MVLGDKVKIPERLSRRGRDIVYCRLVLARLNGDLLKFDLRRERDVRVKEVKRLIADFYNVDDPEDVVLYDIQGGWQDPDPEITHEMQFRNRENMGLLGLTGVMKQKKQAKLMAQKKDLLKKLRVDLKKRHDAEKKKHLKNVGDENEEEQSESVALKEEEEGKKDDDGENHSDQEDSTKKEEEQLPKMLGMINLELIRSLIAKGHPDDPKKKVVSDHEDAMKTTLSSIDGAPSSVTGGEGTNVKSRASSEAGGSKSAKSDKAGSTTGSDKKKKEDPKKKRRASAPEPDSKKKKPSTPEKGDRKNKPGTPDKKSKDHSEQGSAASATKEEPVPEQPPQDVEPQQPVEVIEIPPVVPLPEEAVIATQDTMSQQTVQVLEDGTTQIIETAVRVTTIQPASSTPPAVEQELQIEEIEDATASAKNTVVVPAVAEDQDTDPVQLDEVNATIVPVEEPVPQPRGDKIPDEEIKKEEQDAKNAEMQKMLESEKQALLAKGAKPRDSVNKIEEDAEKAPQKKYMKEAAVAQRKRREAWEAEQARKRAELQRLLAEERALREKIQNDRKQRKKKSEMSKSTKGRVVLEDGTVLEPGDTNWEEVEVEVEELDPVTGLIIMVKRKVRRRKVPVDENGNPITGPGSGLAGDGTNVINGDPDGRSQAVVEQEERFIQKFNLYLAAKAAEMAKQLAEKVDSKEERRKQEEEELQRREERVNEILQQLRAERRAKPKALRALRTHTRERLLAVGGKEENLQEYQRYVQGMKDAFGPKAHEDTDSDIEGDHSVDAEEAEEERKKREDMKQLVKVLWRKIRWLVVGMARLQSLVQASHKAEEAGRGDDDSDPEHMSAERAADKKLRDKQLEDQVRRERRRERRRARRALELGLIQGEPLPESEEEDAVGDLDYSSGEEKDKEWSAETDTVLAGQAVLFEDRMKFNRYDQHATVAIAKGKGEDASAVIAGQMFPTLHSAEQDRHRKEFIFDGALQSGKQLQRKRTDMRNFEKGLEKLDQNLPKLIPEGHEEDAVPKGMMRWKGKLISVTSKKCLVLGLADKKQFQVGEIVHHTNILEKSNPRHLPLLREKIDLTRKKPFFPLVGPPKPLLDTLGMPKQEFWSKKFKEYESELLREVAEIRKAVEKERVPLILRRERGRQLRDRVRTRLKFMKQMSKLMGTSLQDQYNKKAGIAPTEEADGAPASGGGGLFGAGGLKGLLAMAKASGLTQTNLGEDGKEPIATVDPNASESRIGGMKNLIAAMKAQIKKEAQEEATETGVVENPADFEISSPTDTASPTNSPVNRDSQEGSSASLFPDSPIGEGASLVAPTGVLDVVQGGGDTASPSADNSSQQQLPVDPRATEQFPEDVEQMAIDKRGTEQFPEGAVDAASVKTEDASNSAGRTTKEQFLATTAGTTNGFGGPTTSSDGVMNTTLQTTGGNMDGTVRTDGSGGSFAKRGVSFEPKDAAGAAGEQQNQNANGGSPDSQQQTGTVVDPNTTVADLPIIQQELADAVSGGAAPDDQGPPAPPPSTTKQLPAVLKHRSVSDSDTSEIGAKDEELARTLLEEEQQLLVLEQGGKVDNEMLKTYVYTDNVEGTTLSKTDSTYAKLAASSAQGLESLQSEKMLENLNTKLDQQGLVLPDTTDFDPTRDQLPATAVDFIPQEVSEDTVADLEPEEMQQVAAEPRRDLRSLMIKKFRQVKLLQLGKSRVFGSTEKELLGEETEFYLAPEKKRRIEKLRDLHRHLLAPSELERVMESYDTPCKWDKLSDRCLLKDVGCTAIVVIRKKELFLDWDAELDGHVDRVIADAKQREKDAKKKKPVGKGGKISASGKSKSPPKSKSPKPDRGEKKAKAKGILNLGDFYEEEDEEKGPEYTPRGQRILPQNPALLSPRPLSHQVLHPSLLCDRAIRGGYGSNVTITAGADKSPWVSYQWFNPDKLRRKEDKKKKDKSKSPKGKDEKKKKKK
ncbi:unnamed protein product [Amoebophrya sp. A120]|nr:unnamed protein product [Amoebophrya sp. A120]|eukprot:GSA120T00001041001.1